MTDEVDIKDYEKLIPKPKGILGMPYWTWALLVAAAILFFIISIIPKEPGFEMYPTLENKTCDEMVDLYKECLTVREKQNCINYFADPILSCYGEQTLNDQLVLLNQTG